MAIKKSKRFECGCYIFTPVAGIDDYAITYCPRHAAADAMVEALILVDIDITDNYRHISPKTRQKVQAALALAEGDDE